MKYPGLVRDCRWHLPFFLVIALNVGWFAVPSVQAQAPALQLQEVSDPELAEALRAGFNLAEICTTIAAGKMIPADVRAAMLATERRRLTEIMKSFGYLNAETKLDSRADEPGGSEKTGIPAADIGTTCDEAQLTPGKVKFVSGITVAVHGDKQRSFDELREIHESDFAEQKVN